jgi:hypothetical protein
MKRKLPYKRDWTAARMKVEEEGRCRGCGKFAHEARLEAAHVSGREFDELFLHKDCDGAGCAGCNGYGQRYEVHPDDVIPLCGPPTSTHTCHGRHHARRLDLLPLLTTAEQVSAVQHLGGIANAYVVLSGTRKTPEEVAASMPPPDVAHLQGGAFRLYPQTPAPPPRSTGE